jgi:hypothetical protein
MLTVKVNRETLWGNDQVLFCTITLGTYPAGGFPIALGQAAQGKIPLHGTLDQFIITNPIRPDSKLLIWDGANNLLTAYEIDDNAGLVEAPVGTDCSSVTFQAIVIAHA